MMTFGTTKQFPEKVVKPAQGPMYGTFKIGDPLHTGHNKTFGGHGRSDEYNYLEEREEDLVKYQKNVTKPIWRKTAQMSKTMQNSSVSHNARNVNVANSHIFSS
jgi:hypothetical protein